MQDLMIRGFSEGGGINTDRHPTLLQPNTFTDCLNVHFKFGAAETRYGDEPTFQIFEDGEFTNLAPFDPITIFSHGSDWYYGGTNNLAKVLPVNNQHFIINKRDGYIYQPGEKPSEDYPAYVYADTNKWDIEVLSDVITFNSPENIPQVYNEIRFGEYCINMPYWGWTDLEHNYPGFSFTDSQGNVEENPGGPDPDDPENDPDYWQVWRCRGMAAYKNFLVAYDMTEGAEVYPQRVRWSDAALPGYAPQNWNSSSLRSLAGFNDLSEATGPIIHLEPLGDNLVIYTENECFMMSYVGGQEIMNFKKIFDEGGILNKGCAVEFEGRHFVVGSNDIYIHDSSNKSSIAEDAVRLELFDAIATTDTRSVRLFHNFSRHEIWILYSTIQWGDADTKGYPINRAHIYDYSNSCWSKITLPELTDIAIGRTFQTSSSVVTTWAAVMEAELDWDEISETWKPRQTQSFGNQVIKGSRRGDSVEGNYFLDISSDPDYKYEAIDRYLEKVGISADQLKVQGGTTSIYFTDIFPILSSYKKDGVSGKVRFTVTGTHHPTDPVDWEKNVEIYEFEANIDSSVDIRQTWQYLAIRVEFLDLVPYHLHSLDLKARPRGNRTGREIK